MSLSNEDLQTIHTMIHDEIAAETASVKQEIKSMRDELEIVHVAVMQLYNSMLQQDS